MFVLVFITLLSLSIKVNYFVKNCTVVKYNFQTKSETKDRHNKRKSSPFTVTSQWSKHSRCPHNTGSPESDTRRFPPADWAGSKDFTDAWRRKWRPSLQVGHVDEINRSHWSISKFDILFCERNYIIFCISNWIFFIELYINLMEP